MKIKKKEKKKLIMSKHRLYAHMLHFFFESRPAPFPLLKTEIQKFIGRNRNPERRGEVGKTREKVNPSTYSHPA